MKKFIRLLSAIFLFVILTWSVLFVTDYKRTLTLKNPIFAIENTTFDEAGSAIYQGIGYKVVVKKINHFEYGNKIYSVEMYIFNKLIAAAIE